MNKQKFFGYVLLAVGIGVIPLMISTYADNAYGGMIVMTLVTAILVLGGSYLLSNE